MKGKATLILLLFAALAYGRPFFAQINPLAADNYALNSLYPTPDGGVLMGGYWQQQHRPGAGGWWGFTGKLDIDGRVEWCRSDSLAQDSANNTQAVAALTDSLSVALVVSAQKATRLIFRDHDGHYLFQQLLGDFLGHALVASDSMLVAAGGNGEHPTLVATDPKGRVLWRFKAEASGYYNTIAQLTDGYLAAGFVLQDEHQVPYATAFDSRGHRLWEYLGTTSGEVVTLAAGEGEILLCCNGPVLPVPRYYYLLLGCDGRLQKMRAAPLNEGGETYGAVPEGDGYLLLQQKKLVRLSNSLKISTVVSFKGLPAWGGAMCKSQDGLLLGRLLVEDWVTWLVVQKSYPDGEWEP